MIDHNTVALVTGANRGIGKAIVSALLDRGVAKIYAAMRNPASLDADHAAKGVIPIALDVTQAGQVEAAAARASDVTVLFNNAGVLDFGDILTTPLDKVERNFGTNFYGKLLMARAFAPVIERNGGGAIVNTLTLVALASMPGLAAYNASKAAAWSMNQSLRASLADRKVKVIGVFPGAVDTDMLDGVDMDKTNPSDVAKAVIEGVQAGQEDIFPDPMSASVYEAWRSDHKAVEKQFAAM
jgi:NAD(P)-dependent dehydrogenase (short-subunit alcohol dehydrogenase family)